MSKDSPQPQQSEEVDLGQLFKLIGRAFENFFNFIGKILYNIFLAFVWLVFFIKKHFIKIALAGIIGLAFGYLKESVTRPSYRSSAIIKQNYETGEALYEAIDFYDKLVSERDTTILASNLNIDVSKASLIKDFSIEAVTNDNNRIKSYDTYLKSLDSVVASTITYDQYLNISEEFDIPYQKLLVDAYSNESFEDVIINIVNQIKTSQYFLEEQRRDSIELRGRELALKDMLVKSDSLQSVYREVLKLSAESKPEGQTSITIDNTENKSTTKEFELYQNDLQLRRELVDIEREIEEKSKIIEIVSIKKQRGIINDTQDVFGLSISKTIFYALAFVFIAFFTLLSYEFLKFLERYKSKV